MPRHDGEGIIGDIGRDEKRKAVDVISMGVGEQHVGNTSAVFHQAVAKTASARSRIQNKSVVAGLHLYTTGVAAVFHVIGGRAGNASADTPEFNF